MMHLKEKTAVMEEMYDELTGHFDGLGLTEACRVYVADEPHPDNGAHHEYYFDRRAIGDPAFSMTVGSIRFQRGPRSEPSSTPGTLDGAVVSVLIHRFECFQSGPYGCEENKEVLDHLYAVRKLIIERAQERAKRGVLGTNAK